MSSAMPIQLRWLNQPAAAAGVTWGVPWSKGELKRGDLSALCLNGTGEGCSLPLQSRPAAYWPDGSIKWSFHSAVCPDGSTEGYTLERSAVPGDMPALQVSVQETEEAYFIDTGTILCTVGKRGRDQSPGLSAGLQRNPEVPAAIMDIPELRRLAQSSSCAAEVSWSASASSAIRSAVS